MKRIKWKNLANSVLPVFFALLIGAVIMLAMGHNPLNAYRIMFERPLFTLRGLTNTLHIAGPLLLAGLAIAVTFRSNLYNMGVEGQLIFGGFLAGLAGAYLHIPNPFLHKFVCLVVGIIAGMMFVLIPAILRAFLRVDEMVVTLTLNYVMMTVLEYLSSGPFRNQGAGYVSTNTIDKTAMFNRIGKTRLTPFFIIAFLVFLLFFFMHKRMVFGYRGEAVGKNPEFAEATGLRVRRHIVQVMIISGALAGLAGAGHMMSHEFNYTLSFSGTPGIGWDGMLISLLGGHSPAGVLIATVFYSALKTGSDNINMYTGIPKEIVAIIQGLIVLFLSIRFINDRFGLTKRWRNKRNMKGTVHGTFE